MIRFIVEGKNKTSFALDVNAGDRIVDICDTNVTPIPFSCRGASCGTCRIDVIEGAELLDAPKDEELDVLDIFGDKPGKRRLACQASFIASAAGTVRVSPVDD